VSQALRSPVGRIWLELVVKHYLACRDANRGRQATLFDLLDGIADEYPEAVQAEIEAYRAASAPVPEAAPTQPRLVRNGA
jgi:hypothetical protein